ncbi:MAG: hypothetical protein WCQ49_03000 [Candidatus Saccharibacteria bacterium]
MKKLKEIIRDRKTKKLWAMVEALYKAMPEFQDSLAADCWNIYSDALNRKMSYRKAFKKAENYGIERLIEAEKRLGVKDSNISSNIRFYKSATILLFFISIILIIALIISNVSLVKATIKTQEKLAPTPTKAALLSTSTIEADAKKLLASAGWEEKDYLVGDKVIQEKDTATRGERSFSFRSVKDVKGMISFLEFDGIESKTFLNYTKNSTKSANNQEVLDKSNWAVFQSGIDFIYPGNMMYKDGKAIEAGLRDGKKGDIFFIYRSPTSGLFAIVRGACANPQLIVPTKKSTNPKDYKRPGDGLERDLGTGVKPTIPKGEITPEVKPTVVITAAPASPGAEDAGIVAKDANPTPVQLPSTISITPTPTLPPEPGSNKPTGGGPRPSTTPTPFPVPWG